MHKYNTSSGHTGINNDEAEYTHPNWMSACKYRSGNICVKNKEWCILSWPFTEEELLSLWFVKKETVYRKCAIDFITWYCEDIVKECHVNEIEKILKEHFPEA
jgi:hypothetical protein